MLGDNIKSRRKKLKITQAELGTAVGVSAQVISNWERGYTPDISSSDLAKLSKALECSTDELLGKFSSDYIVSRAENSPIGTALLEDEFISALAIAKGKCPDEMEMLIRRILKFDVIKIGGLHNSERFIEKIKEVMLSNNDDLNRNIVEADFLFSLSEMNGRSILSNEEQNSLILHMKNAVSVCPGLIKLIERDSTLYDILISELDKSKLTDFDLLDFRAHDITKTVSVPIIGTIKAGPNGLAFEEPLGYHRISSDSISEEYPSYCLRVRGDSMSPYLLPGDLVLFQENPDIPSGSLAIVIVDGEEGTVKWLKRGEGFIRLEAENPYYPAREFAGKDLLDIRIVGPVTEIMRKPIKKNGIIPK